MIARGLSPGYRSSLAKYAAAALFVGLAVVARRVLDPVFSDRQPFPTFYVSLTAAAWLGGLGPTLFALIFGYLAGDWFFVQPHHTFSALNLANTGAYFFVGLAITVFTQMMHTAQDRAEANAQEARDRQREREQLFEELLTARGRLEAVLRQMPAGVVIAEAPTGRIVLANAQVDQIRQRTRGGLDDDAGIDVAALRDKSGRPFLRHEWPLARSLATGEVVQNEEARYPRDNGEWGTMFVSSSPIRDPNGAIVAAVAILYDITARKRAEDALLRAHDELEGRVARRTADLARANESLRAEVAERRLAEQARNELLRRLVVVEEDERARIARELHDQMGQQLTALKLGLEALAGVVGHSDQLRRLLALTRQIGRDMHRIAWELGPAALEELDLPAALSSYAEEWSGHSGVPARLQCTGPWNARLPSQVETTLYRVAQEALTNVAKHARAGRLSLILNRRADDVLVIIEDDGIGFDPDGHEPARPGRRLGLTGMRQRVQAVGGMIQIESTPGGGTTLFVRVPIRNDGERASHG